MNYLIRTHPRMMAGMSYDVHAAIWAKSDLEEAIGVLHTVHDHAKYLIAHNFPPAPGLPSSVHATRDPLNLPPLLPIPVGVAAVLPGEMNAPPPVMDPPPGPSAEVNHNDKRPFEDPRLEAMYDNVMKSARIIGPPYNPSDDEDCDAEYPPPTPAHE